MEDPTMRISLSNDSVVVYDEVRRSRLLRIRKRKLRIPRSSVPRSVFVTILLFLCCCDHRRCSEKNSRHPANQWVGSSAACLPMLCAPTSFAMAADEEAPNSLRRPLLQRKKVTASTKIAAPQPSLNQILYRAGMRGLGGGVPGAAAGVLQVLCLMWLRTIINYQCRYGTNFGQALRTLWQDGGVARLYRGVLFALIQAPLSRFVSTAANDGIEALLANLSWTASWGPGRTTIVASIVVGMWRLFLMPIDTMKTVLQVDSFEGFRSLMRRVKAGKINVLYSGGIANAVSAILGHYPWFYTYNTLSTSERVRRFLPSQHFRNAGIGVLASIVSDTVVNAARVIKTTKQSLGSKQSATYADTVKIIIAADGWRGLFGRGLRTRIFANALQSLVFTVVWRGLADLWRKKEPSNDAPSDRSSSKT